MQPVLQDSENCGKKKKKKVYLYKKKQQQQQHTITLGLLWLEGICRLCIMLEQLNYSSIPNEGVSPFHN